MRLQETYVTAGTGFTSTRRVFAFGTHPTATDADEHPVTQASASGNALRIIMDELLQGDRLEEVACRAPVNTDGSFSKVPDGTTPDDIAHCSTAQDILPATCKGPHTVCLCDLAAGCMVNTTLVAQGAPVGVLDMNQDGSADDSELIKGAVGLTCGAITVDIDQNMSYWNPSGNQQVPAMGGFEALGPAIVLVPARGLPTSLKCHLTFGNGDNGTPVVLDKQGIAPCAPVDGDVKNDCTPGDTSAFEFQVEALKLDAGFGMDGMTGVSRMDPLIFLGNAQLDMTSVLAAGNVTITPAPPATPVITIDMGQNIKITVPGGLAPNTMYTVTFTTGVHDNYGQSAPAAIVYHFTTGA
ncbi:MAG TPA: Ig-like domain-containing protein [Kofleriaceae bacterium]